MGTKIRRLPTGQSRLVAWPPDPSTGPSGPRPCGTPPYGHRPTNPWCPTTTASARTKAVALAVVAVTPSIHSALRWYRPAGTTSSQFATRHCDERCSVRDHGCSARASPGTLDLAPRRSGTPSPWPLTNVLSFVDNLASDSTVKIFARAPPRTGTQPVRGQPARPNSQTHTRAATARLPPHPFLHRQGGAYLMLPPKDEGIA